MEALGSRWRREAVLSRIEMGVLVSRIKMEAPVSRGLDTDFKNLTVDYANRQLVFNRSGLVYFNSVFTV
jgi:hypothetical protein